MSESVILDKINSFIYFVQSKCEYLRQNSLLVQKFDNLIFLSIILTFGVGLFCPTGKIGACIFLTLFLTVINLFISDKQRLEPKSFDIALFVFLIISMISMFNSTLPLASLKGLFKTLTYMGFYFSVVQFFSYNKSKIKYLIFIVSGCILLESVIAIIQNYTNVLPLASWQDVSQTNPEDIISRAFGTLQPYNPNLLAAYLVIGFPLILYSAFLKFNSKKVFATILVSSLIVALAIVLTGSRGAYLGLGAMLGCVVFVSYKIIFKDLQNTTLQKFWKTTVASGIGLITILILSTPAILKRILSIFILRGDSSTSFRMNVYKSSFAMFQDNPILGIGLGNTTFREIYGYYMQSGFDALSAYSIYLETAVETGILGLIAFLSFLILLLKNAVKYIFSGKDLMQKVYISCCVASVLGALVHGCFDTVFFRPQVQCIFWFVIALLNINLNEYSLQNK